MLAGLKDRLCVSENIILLDCKRIVVPSASVTHILRRLHAGHCGQDKAHNLAQSLFYWPGMGKDIKTFISSCREGFAKLPSQSSNPCVTEPLSSSFGPPFAALGLNLFEHGGNKFLICVDKWSGYPVYKKLQALTAKAITNHLQVWFNLLGWPSFIRSDGGTQFCGYFREWYNSHNINHKISSPYNPKSNGLAEAAVKTSKHLLSKCLATGQDCEKAIYEWRNVPRSDGFCPAKLLFGCRQYTSLPIATAHHELCDIKKAKIAKDDNFHAKMECHDQHKKILPSLEVGQAVIAQDPHSKKGLMRR